MQELRTPEYFREERANVLTHFPGIPLALIGTPLLVSAARENGSSMFQSFGIWTFGFSMLMVYFASVLYHSVHHVEYKKFCRKLDHIAIFFLIAGTHTPIILRYLDNPKGYIFLSILWTIGLIGMIGKLVALEKWPKFSLALYLLMGWMFVFILPFIWSEISAEVLVWIAIGGFCYSAGAIFYAHKKPAGFHAIWHVFVLLGTTGHYVAVWKAFS